LDNITRFAERRQELPAEQRPRMNFNYIMMKRTIAEAPRFVEMVHELGGDEIIFNHLVAFHPSLEDESLQKHKQLANENMDRCRELAKKLGVTLHIPQNFNLDAEAESSESGGQENGNEPKARPCGPPPIKCWFLWKRVYIGVNGEVIPCCLAGIPNFGSMMDEPFWDIWNGETYRTYRKHVYTDNPYGPCKNCYLIYQSPDQTEAEGFQKY
jgi:MoaA/NifB/PqqE/SkfB family radical SAM enzyme